MSHRIHLVPGLQQAELSWPDTTCVRAYEDRDLVAEALNLHGQVEALYQTFSRLYPHSTDSKGQVVISRWN